MPISQNSESQQTEPQTEPKYPVVLVDVTAEESEETSLTLFEMGATGVEERDHSTLNKGRNAEVLLVAHFDDEDTARLACEVIGAHASLDWIVGDDWKFRWRDFFHATRVGERVVIRPPWEQWPNERSEATPGQEARDTDVILTIDPGQAFGTGTHETTRLVVRELETFAKEGDRVLDVGCGSGILSIAAILLGATNARGLDIDEESMQATAENAEANGVGDRVHAFRDDVTDEKDTYPLVVANIESRTLLPLKEAIKKTVAPGGTLILSGLLFQEEEELIAAYAPLSHVRTSRMNDWICMVFQRSV